MDQPPNHLNISFQGLVGLNEEEIEHELNNNFYVLDKNVTVVIIEPDVIHDLKTGTFLEPPPLTKIHHETEDLFLNDLPQDYIEKQCDLHSMASRLHDRQIQVDANLLKQIVLSKYRINLI
ncbi:hypothetical protein M0813_18273 [Anaeramoeba flamelloides]|uniref:Uncharacterized protein n=1 Tax=Anaeramoeba flamelloides TaxID=1746091 RepID=A0ABQ8YSL8_9EUKA|nr:hypothetical protein M0813_18273 [Anaeramoeba flamelloides]